METVRHGFGRQAAVSLAHPAEILTGVFSPEGSKVLLSGADARSTVWDARTGKLLVTLQHDGGQLAARFSPDSTKVLTVGASSVRVWNSDGTPYGPPLEHPGLPELALWSAHGLRVTTLCGGEAMLWDAGNGSLLVEPIALDTRGADVSADGLRLLSVADDAVRLFSLPTDSRPLGTWEALARHGPYLLENEVLVENSASPGATRSHGANTIPTIKFGQRAPPTKAATFP